MIETTRDKTVVNRDVYNLSGFLNDFGAWAQAMIFIGFMVAPLLYRKTLESYLISKLYKVQRRH